MDPSIHQHVLACKMRDDIEAATNARTAKDLTRKPRPEKRITLRRRFVRPATPTAPVSGD
jgi:hypothetical protein